MFITGSGLTTSFLLLLTQRTGQYLLASYIAAAADATELAAAPRVSDKFAEFSVVEQS